MIPIQRAKIIIIPAHILARLSKKLWAVDKSFNSNMIRAGIKKKQTYFTTEENGSQSPNKGVDSAEPNRHTDTYTHWIKARKSGFIFFYCILQLATRLNANKMICEPAVTVATRAHSFVHREQSNK